MEGSSTFYVEPRNNQNKIQRDYVFLYLKFSVGKGSRQMQYNQEMEGIKEMSHLVI